MSEPWEPDFEEGIDWRPPLPMPLRFKETECQNCGTSVVGELFILNSDGLPLCVECIP